MKKMILIFLAVFVFSGCASIVSKSKQEVRITSSPLGANVAITDRRGATVEGITPVLVRLKRGAGYFKKAAYAVEIFKEGYEKQTVQISSRVNKWYWVNIPLFIGLLGPIGMLILDPATGAMWTLKPDRIHVNLEQSLSFHENENTNGIYILLKDEIPEDVFDKLEPARIN